MFANAKPDDVFLLDPRNAAVLEGASRRPQYNFSNRDFQPAIGCIIILLAGCSATFLLGIVGLIWIGDLLFDTQGATTQATITDCYMRDEYTYVAEYEYIVDDVRYEDSESLIQTCEDYAVGTQIEIRYLVDVPETSQLIRGFEGLGGGLLAMAIIGGILLIVALYLIYAALRTRRHFARLESKGIVLYGIIDDVKRGYRGQPIVKYSFPNQEGITLYGEAVPKFYTSLPYANMSIAVLYADDTCYRAL